MFSCSTSSRKVFETFLIFKGIEFGRTHDVDFLLSECIAQHKADFENLDLRNLNDYAVSVRYPDDFFIP